MADDIDFLLKRNGLLGKSPLRELHEIGFERPTEFDRGVAILHLTHVAHRVALAIFFEHEPDAFYYFEPNADTQNQIEEHA